MNAQFKKGVLEMCVLCILSQRDYYGFELVSAIPMEINMAEGTIYPLLKRLQESGMLTTYWAESLSGPPRKYYRITECGRQSFELMYEQWQTFSDAINQMLMIR